MTHTRPLLEEHDIRRALRLDAEEVPPRLDPALIAAAARISTSRGSTGIAVAAGAAFLGGWAWSEVFRALVSTVLATTDLDPVGGAIDLATFALVQLGPIADAASAPVVPIAILVAALAAAAFEQMKGRVHATPS